MQCLTCLLAVVLLVFGALTDRVWLVVLAIGLFLWSRLGRNQSLLPTLAGAAMTDEKIIDNAPRNLGDYKVRSSSGATAGPASSGAALGDSCG